MAADRVLRVLFDADGVIQHPGPFLEELRIRLSWPPSRLASFMSAVFEIERPRLLDPLGMSAALADALEAHGVELTPEDFLNGWFRRGIVPDDELLEVVTAIRATGVGCDLATNQARERLEFMLVALGYEARFDRCWASCEMGVAKPDGAYFDAIIGSLDCLPNQVLFIDDNERNVEAARSCGLRAMAASGTDQVLEVLARHGLPTQQAAL